MLQSFVRSGLFSNIMQTPDQCCFLWKTRFLMPLRIWDVLRECIIGIVRECQPELVTPIWLVSWQNMQVVQVQRIWVILSVSKGRELLNFIWSFSKAFYLPLSWKNAFWLSAAKESFESFAQAWERGLPKKKILFKNFLRHFLQVHRKSFTGCRTEAKTPLWTYCTFIAQ